MDAREKLDKATTQNRCGCRRCYFGMKRWEKVEGRRAKQDEEKENALTHRQTKDDRDRGLGRLANDMGVFGVRTRGTSDLDEFGLGCGVKGLQVAKVGMDGSGFQSGLFPAAIQRVDNIDSWNGFSEAFV